MTGFYPWDSSFPRAERTHGSGTWDRGFHGSTWPRCLRSRETSTSPECHFILLTSTRLLLVHPSPGVSLPVSLGLYRSARYLLVDRHPDPIRDILPSRPSPAGMNLNFVDVPVSRNPQVSLVFHSRVVLNLRRFPQTFI